MIKSAKSKPELPPAPALQRYCAKCESYKAAKYFSDKRKTAPCDTCKEHARQRAESQVLDPAQDERLAALRAELGPTDRVEINLPGVEHWVQQYIAANGGIEGAMNRLLAQLEWAEKHKPGSKAVFDIHQFFIKLHFGISVARENRERHESPMNLGEAFDVMKKLEARYLPLMSNLSEQAAKALGNEVAAHEFTLPEATPEHAPQP